MGLPFLVRVGLVIWAALGLANPGAAQPVPVSFGPPVVSTAATPGAVNDRSAATLSPFAVGSSPLAVIEDAGAPYRTAVGSQALLGTFGWYNTGIGYRALRFNTQGEANTASGFEALLSNTVGVGNTASGFQALGSNTTGGGNTAIGLVALQQNTTGLSNTGSGGYALSMNTTGSYNTVSGFTALYQNTTGSGNAANGAEALYRNTSGAENTAAGLGALSWNTTGMYNVASGAYALYLNSTGSKNAALGYHAGLAATTGSYNVFLGADVDGTATDTNTIRIGLPYNSGTGVGQNQTFIAGIHGTQVQGGYLPVVVNASGQLGTLIPAVLTGGPAALVTPAAVEQQLEEQRAINAEQQTTIAALRQRSQAQQATIEDLVARLARLEAASRAARRQ